MINIISLNKKIDKVIKNPTSLIDRMLIIISTFIFTKFMDN